MIKRYYSGKLGKLLKPGRALILYGPRQVGKTTLAKEFLDSYKGKMYQQSGENARLQDVLESNDFSKIIPFFTGYDLIFIDEAQKVSNVGQGLKILIDQIKGVKIIATGSSSFDLSNKIGEPLVGRQKVIKLFPFSVMELRESFGASYVFENLENLLIFGAYPEVIKEKVLREKIDYLNLLRDGFLFKDIFELQQVKNPKKILDLLRLLAFQIGQEVSLQELGQKLGMSKNTVERYLDLLEKVFVIINIRGFSRNLRKEITKTSRYYFYDNGVRNAVIGNFNYLNSRDDMGRLWENFLVSERLKFQEYKGIYGNNYFWRTWDGQEIDWIEEREGKLYGFEFKWGSKLAKAPKDWLKTYKEAEYKVINRDNYINFLDKKKGRGGAG